ncbi:MAG: histidine triad nucleotide-binding protein [Fidelibacterota bacterium]
MTDCLFCGISTGDVPSDIVYQTDNVVAFRDIHPQAPHHLLIIPRKHIPTLNDLSEDDAALIGEMILAARKLASDLGIDRSGYRTVFNCNADAGQAVFHVHLHLLGGRRMSWPPG